MGWNSKLFDHKIMCVRNSSDDGLTGVASFDGFIKIVDMAKSLFLNIKLENLTDVFRGNNRVLF